MAERVWDKFLTEEDKAVFKASGYGVVGEYGKKPAVLVVDVNYNFTGDRNEPILESIKRWPNSCGEYAWEALPHLQTLLDASRKKGLPVIYTTGTSREDGWDRGGWSWKNSRTSEARKHHVSNLDGNEINAEIAPEAQDIVIKKLKPSGFFGTPLAAFLVQLGADSIIMTGTTTSGCVRASVIDAFSLNYKITLVEEGCFDRAQASHAINLCDMNAKYANVMPLSNVLSYIHTLPNGLFDLPKGASAAAR